MANNPELDKLDMDNTKTSIELETVQLEESSL